MNKIDKNRKLLKEWKKIETANIFSTVEEFADFYYSNGEKSCFKILTNEPWSKDNFFFGEYSELLNYYKYEFPKRRIGQKFHSLTIIDVFYKKVNGEEVLYAKCKCDCGNEIEKLMDAITKGNARTCGCKTKKRKSGNIKNNLYELFPNIIEKYWDYNRNQILPQNVSVSSKDEYWWKGFNHSYKMPLSALMKKRSGTSFPEQTILFFLKKNNIDVLNRHLIKKDKKTYEIDLFLPKYNIGIEYDGVAWHKDKQKLDNEKNEEIEKVGIFLIRIREKGLPRTNLNKGKEIFVDLDEGETALAESINELFSFLEQEIECKLEKIDSQEIKINKFLIYKQYLFSYREDSISNSPLIEYWSKDNGIEPYLVSVDSSDKFVFECVCGKKFNVAPQRIYSKIKNKNEGCLLRCAGVCDKLEILPEGLIVNCIVHKESKVNTIKMRLFLENHYNVWWQEIQANKCYVIDGEGVFFVSNKKIECKRNKIDKIEKPLYEQCLINLFTLGLGQVVPPYSKVQYDFELYNPIDADKDFNMIMENEILDSENWIYKIIIAVKKKNNNIFVRCKTFSQEQLCYILWGYKTAYKYFTKEYEFNKIEIVELFNYMFSEEKIEQTIHPKEAYKKALNIYGIEKFNQAKIKEGNIVVHSELKEGKITKIIGGKSIYVSFPIIDVVFSIESFRNGIVRIKEDNPICEPFIKVYKRILES